LERVFSLSRWHNTQADWEYKKNLQKSFHRDNGERKPRHWPTTSQPQSKADCFLIRLAEPFRRRTPAPRDQPRHKPRQSRTMARHGAFALLAGGNPRPHSSRTGFDRRTVPAQPHKSAQVFLLIIAQRCKIMLALRGKRLYLRG